MSEKSFAGRHGDKVAYVAVGIWNTLFGYGLYVALLAMVGKQAYWWLLIPVNLIAITQNYLAYKFLVFKTRGNYLREYLRFYLVYGPVVIVNLFLLPLLVRGLGWNPVVAQGLFTVGAVVVTYVGHRYFTFKGPEDVAGTSPVRVEPRE